MRGIKSTKHKLFTYKNDKVSTSCFDDKRYILFDGINILPYGRKDIPKSESNKKMFLWHIRKLNMIEKENNKYPPPTLINDIKNKKLKEKLINILNNIDEISNKKINDFEESLKKFKNKKKL